MMNWILVTKMINYKQRDQDSTKGKKGFRLREIQEQEELQQVREYISSRMSCKDDLDTQTVTETK